jgi:hypothetical protein
MYQPNTSSLIKKGLLSSAVLAAASLVFTAAPASACTTSPGAKPKVATPLSASVATMALAQSASVTASKRQSNGFVGLWDTKVISGGQVVDEGFDAFHSDGTEILVDESNPITDNVCLGIWEQAGPSTIKLKHPSWYFDTNGNLLGVVIIYETLKLDPDGDSYHGTSVEDVYDTQGNKIGHYEAQIQANRITVS